MQSCQHNNVITGGYTLPVMQSNRHRLPSVYRVLHTLTKTTPQKQKHSILTFEVFQSKVANIQS